MISLFYAHSSNGGQTFTNHEIDEVAIDTMRLQQPEFIGDYIRITTADDAVVIVYDATGVLVPWPWTVYVEQIHSARIVWE